MSQIIDIEKIIEMMPHRYPFLLIDRLIKVEKDYLRGCIFFDFGEIGI